MENTFLSIAGGLNGYGNDTYGPLDNRCAHVEGAFGYRFSNRIAFRARITGMTNQAASGLVGKYLYATGDLMWNITNTIHGFNYNRRASMQAFYGFGLVHATTGDNDFALSLGLRGEVRAVALLSLFAEAKTMLHPSLFDGNGSISFAPMVTAGFSLVVNENAYHNKDKAGMPSADSDWDVAIGFPSLSSFNYSGIATPMQRLSQLRPAAQVAVEKRVTPCWVGRFMLAGGMGAYQDIEELPLNPEPQQVDYAFRYATFHADLMLDVVQAATRSHHMHRITCYPYMGAGMLLRTDYAHETQLALDGGILLRYILNGRSDLFVDARYALTESNFAHLQGFPQGRFSVGIATLSLGYIINIGEGRFRKTY